MVMLYVSTDEGVYVDSNGRPTKDVQLQWGEVPSSIGKLTIRVHIERNQVFLLHTLTFYYSI